MISCIPMDENNKIPSNKVLLERNQNLGSTQEDQWRILSFVIDASNNCICITDPTQKDNPIIYVNKGFELLTGYSRAEAVGQNCRFLQASDKAQEGIISLREAVKKGESAQVILRNYRKDGSLFWNELFVSPIYDESGELIYFTGVQNDISKRIQHETNLQQAIEATFADPAWFASSVMDNLVRIRGGKINAGGLNELTEREKETLDLLARGLKNSQIAEHLGLSVHTVRNYLANVYEKLDVQSRTDAAIWARKRGLGSDF